MNYLCAAVKREVVTSKKFYSRKEALAYFQQKFGERVRDRMEENEIRLERKIQCLERKLKKYGDDPEMNRKISERKQEAEEKWTAIERWLNGEDDQNAVYIEEKFDQYKEQLITEEAELFFYMAGIYNLGNRYMVTEEKYYYMCRVVANTEKSAEAIRRLPEEMTKNNSSLYICEENPETVEKYVKQISKIKVQVRRDYYKNRTLMKNTGIFTEL